MQRTEAFDLKTDFRGSDSRISLPQGEVRCAKLQQCIMHCPSNQKGTKLLRDTDKLNGIGGFGGESYCHCHSVTKRHMATDETERSKV